MTDPTPTRAEVEALVDRLKYNAEITDYLEDREAMNQAAEIIRALRERAEAAEAVRDLLDGACFALDLQLTAARRAEAAAWNDAIEAAANLESIHGYSNAVPRHRIRALRRAAPTEGEA